MKREIKFRAWNGKEMTNRFGFYLNLEGEVKPSIAHILMQYTGLKDKNGKDIYEGDILRRPANIIEPCDLITFDLFSVSFENGSFVMDDCGDVLWDWNEESEVIGNIYEDAYLLSNSDKSAQECDAAQDDSSKTA